MLKKLNELYSKIVYESTEDPWYRKITKDNEFFNYYLNPLAKEYKVMSIPYMLILKDGEIMTELVGFHTKDDIKTEFEKCYKLEKDPRVTKIGNFLRKTSLDELPQILNILKGELSIIGPRPIVQAELEKYGDDKEKFLSVKPGLTGYWAANGRSDTSYEERIQMELYYVDNMSFWLDIKVFFKTILAVLKKEGAR